MSETPTGGTGEASTGGHALSEESPVVDLSLDAVFGLLADQRRRYLLHALRSADGDVTDVETVTTLVVEWEALLSDVRRSDVRASLENTHLPVLDRAGVVDFDSRSGAIRYFGHPSVEEYLDHVAPVEHRE